MAHEFATGTFNIGTGAATTTTVVSGLGFQPQMVWFWWSGSTSSTDAGGSATYNRGFGAATSASSFFAVGNRYVDALGTADTECGQTVTGCILEMAADASAGIADLQSFDSGGFTLEIITQFTTNFRVSYAAFAGLNGASTGTIALSGTAPTTNTLASGLSYTPTGYILVSVGIASANETFVDGNANISIGACTSTSDEHCLWASGDDGATSGDGSNYCLAGELLAITASNAATATSGPTQRVDHSSFGASSITIGIVERSVALRVYYCAWGGSNIKVGDNLTQTDTSTAINTGSLGFTPVGVVVFSGGNAATTADATPAVHDEWSVGAASSTSNRNAQAACSRDGNTNMFSQTFIEHDEVYINVDPATDAIEGLMDVQAFNSDSIDFIMDDADPSQAFFWWVAVGNPSAGGRTTKNTRAWPLGTEVGMGWRMPC
jgi:hypothetical protein